jgi:hypothetical protein
MKPPDRRRLWPLLLLLAGLSVHGAEARDERQYEVAPLRVIDDEAEIGFEYYHYGEDQKRDGEGSVKFRNNTFQEYVQYKARGYVYHPRLFYYRGRARIGYVQQYISRSGLEDDRGNLEHSSAVDGFDFFGEILKEHTVSAAIFATREKRPVFGLFTDKYMMQTETIGAKLLWKNDVVPMEWGYSESRFEEWGIDSRTTTSSDVFSYTAHNRLGNWSRSRFNYKYQKYEQEFQAQNRWIDIERETDLDSHDANLSNVIYLRPDRKSNLTSLGRYYKQTGTTDIETTMINERLRLQHTEDLSTYYQAGVTRSENSNTTIDSYRGEMGVDHELFDSLRSHFDIHGRRTEYDDAREDRYGVTGRLDYRKDTGVGELTAGYSRTLDQVSRSGAAGTRPVFDEPIVLSLSEYAFLDLPNVDENTITITDVSGLNTYFRGFDYEVTDIGGRTGLRLLPGGSIPEGSTVLVDYNAESFNDQDYISDDEMMYVRHDFERIVKGLSLYYRKHDVDAHSLPDDMPVKVLEFTDHLFGMQYRRDWFRWTEEAEIYRSNFTDYNQLRSVIEGRHRLHSRLRWGWNIGHTWTDYDEDINGDGETTSDIIFAGTSLNGTFLERGYWSLEGRGQRESGRTDQTIVGALAKFGIKWRKVRLEAGARAEHHEVFESDRDRWQLYVQLARIF